VPTEGHEFVEHSRRMFGGLNCHLGEDHLSNDLYPQDRVDAELGLPHLCNRCVGFGFIDERVLRGAVCRRKFRCVQHPRTLRKGSPRSDVRVLSVAACILELIQVAVVAEHVSFGRVCLEDVLPVLVCE